MQRIERYGVIALVFLLVTILAVAVWGQRKNQSLLSFLKRDKAATELAGAETPPITPLPSADPLNLSTPSHELQPTSPIGTGGSLATGTPTGTSPLLPAPGGPGSAAVTFDQGPQLTQVGNPNAGFIDAQNNLIGGSTLQPAPITSGPRSYVVKNGDTLGTIAQRELGSTKRWKEIEALNNVKPERLSVGMTLKLPAGGAPVAQPLVAVSEPVAKPKAIQLQPNKPAGRTYSVRSGDSLSKIAAAQLGNADRHGEILALNPGINANKLSVGQVLRLPASSGTAARTQKPKARESSESATVAKAVSTPKKSKVQ